MVLKGTTYLTVFLTGQSHQRKAHYLVPFTIKLKCPEANNKKIRDTKGTFHAKMGSIKDRNGMDLTEAEDIKVAR